MSNDLELRNTRLMFYKKDVATIDKIMEEFLKLSQSKSAFLVDKDGHMITQVGCAVEIDNDTISALVAGSFAATKEMAKILGEQEFSALYHQGESDNIQLSLVGDRTIFTVIFDESTTLGMVRLYVSETVCKLAEVFKEVMRSQSEDHPSEILDSTYSSTAKNKLDTLFD